VRGQGLFLPVGSDLTVPETDSDGRRRRRGQSGSANGADGQSWMELGRRAMKDGRKLLRFDSEFFTQRLLELELEYPFVFT